MKLHLGEKNEVKISWNKLASSSGVDAVFPFKQRVTGRLSARLTCFKCLKMLPMFLEQKKDFGEIFCPLPFYRKLIIDKSVVTAKYLERFCLAIEI